MSLAPMILDYNYSFLGATALRNSYPDYRWPSNIIDLNCVGDEMSIWNCSYNRKPLTTYCFGDAAVVCQCKKMHI